MKQALLQNIQDIERECKIIKKTLESTDIPKELMPFHVWIVKVIDNTQRDNSNNEYLLNQNRLNLFKELYKKTQRNVNILRLLATQYVPVLQRYNKNDNLAISFIAWLHQQHRQSIHKPFGLSNGSFSILPDVNNPMIYYLPTSSQLNLLHFPLFFHEFGHFLYAAHQQEVEDLIKEFQSKIRDKIVIVNEENTKKNEKQREKNIEIIETWFHWMQEFFCDAVGLYIGGKSYLHTFSLYIRTSGNASFYLSEEYLKGSSHPVSWLRIKFLAHRAKTLGLEKEAIELENLWKEIAKMLNAPKERYHGYYEDSFFESINECLDDMIEETQPICFQDYIKNTDNPLSEKMNFIELVNWAWDNADNDEKIETYMKTNGYL